MLKKVKNLQGRSSLTIFFATGLYQISIGLIANLLVSILLGSSIIIFYPIINTSILRILMITGCILISLGIYTMIFPFLKKLIMKKDIIFRTFLIILKINAFLTLILIPIGIFLGNGLRSELKVIKFNEYNQEIRKEKEVSFIYTFMIFLAGFIHVILGIFLLFLLIPFISKEIDFLFPYITYDLLSVFRIIGWICFIPGTVLLLCSIGAKKLISFKEDVSNSYYIKIIRVLILVSSAFLLIVYPIGTFFSSILILEFHHSKFKGE